MCIKSKEDNKNSKGKTQTSKLQRKSQNYSSRHRHSEPFVCHPDPCAFLRKQEHGEGSHDKLRRGISEILRLTLFAQDDRLTV